MREFFRGWRRKIGVMMLVMALIVTAIWARTWTTHDSINWRAEPQSLVAVISSHSCLRLEWLHTTPQAPTGWGWPDSFEFVSYPASYDTGIFLEPLTIKRRLEWCGFCVGEVVAFDRPDARLVISQWSVPYWSIVLPLTLLSTYLLLSKPRPKKPSEATKLTGEAKVTHA